MNTNDLTTAATFRELVRISRLMEQGLDTDADRAIVRDLVDADLCSDDLNEYLMEEVEPQIAYDELVELYLELDLAPDEIEQ